ncbi:MAG: DNA internalization-related competence protein ComEC/Rec2 [Sulfurifustaceae bacterium]
MQLAAIAFLAGIMIVQQLPVLPSLLWALTLVPAALAVLWHPRWTILVFLVAGFAWACFRADLILRERLPAELEGRDVIVEGTIAELPEPTEYGVRFVLDVERASSDSAPVTVTSRLRLTAHELRPRAGERWRFTVRLKRPHGLQNPGGFDYEAFLFREHIRATGYVRDEDEAVRLGESGGLYRMNQWRQTLGDRMRSVMPALAQSELIVALANGDSGGITDAQWETLRATGTLHLVAISGLHITLVAGVVYWLVRLLWSLPGFTVLWLPAQLAAAVGGLIAAIFYAALAGFVVPTQRALIMLAVAMGAVLLRRRLPPTQLLAAALLLVLLLDPFAAMAPGFWLSYAAVAVIVYVMHGRPGVVPWYRKWGYLQWAIAVGMLPLTLWLFQRVSLAAPIANLLAVPVFDLLAVPLTLIGAFCVSVGIDSVAAWMFGAADGLLGWLWQALEFLATLEHVQWIQHRPPLWALVCGLVGVALLLAPRGWPARVVGVIWLLPMFLIRPVGPAGGDVWFTLLDVGQGLAAVVRTEAHTLVFDTGARWSARSDAGRGVVVPYLRAYGIERVDTLLVSHGDNDHAGGATSVVRAFAVGRTLTGTTKVAGEPCRAGLRWRWDGVEFAVLNPDGEPGKHNDASCVLRVRGAHGTILLPADIEKKAERRLIEREGSKGLAADILVAPHHGSRTSSTPGFLDAVHPRYVAFPVGYRNRYRHPHPLVLERYRGTDARLLDSPSAGAIEFQLTSAGIATSRYREQHRRYWFADASPP